MNQNKITKISFKRKSQYLNSLFKTIPTNTYINKFLPNTGATTMEIKAKRHSIIIEPNVPVIEGKEELHNKDVLKVIGVHEDVTYFHIRDYLNSDVQYKKIITTPESYPKVKTAIDKSKFNRYKDFFILLDECERVIQDCVYRKKITLPFDDFFQYKGKAMISATPLIPSDPRFAKFKQIQIVPKFDYKKELTLVTTNSLILSLRKYMDQNPDEHYFIFLNSTEVAASIITALDIKSESNMYCARESVYSLKINNFPNSYERIPQIDDRTESFKKYNFFTSRFFSAVDIKLKYKPTVILLTDTIHAFHSTLDPITESVQILGRLRNGIKKAVHISTTNLPFKPRTLGESKAYLEGCEKTYQDLQALHKSCTNEGGIATLKEALERVEYAEYLNEDGSKNHFMWDNFINEERVKAYYHTKERLVAAYSKCKHFKMTYSEDEFPKIELVLNRLTKSLSHNLTCRKVCEALEDLTYSSEKYTVENILYVHKQIERSFPDVIKAYNALGYHKMQSLEFNKFKIKKAIYAKKSESEKGNLQFLNLLKLEFEVGSSYPSQIIIRVLRRIITDLNLSLKPEITLLKEFFELGPRTSVERTTDMSTGKKKDIKGYTVLKRNFN